MKPPKKVRIVEIAPRDGFQSVRGRWIETGDKIAVVGMLLDAGPQAVEITSFVSPKAIEQMKDAAEVAAAITPQADRDRVYALVPNARGVENALAAGIWNVAVVISASEAHNQNNVRRSPAQSLEELAAIRERFPEVHIKLDVGTAFGCPFTGDVPEKDVTFLIDRAVALGIHDVVLCDTVGVANPAQVKRLLGNLGDRYAGRPMDWGLHLHNTRGLASANALAALELGFDRFETAAGGLGGCPFAPGASGNLATEDLVFMLEEMGVETGVDLSRVIACAEYMRDRIGLALDARITRLTKNKVTAATA